MSNDILYVRFQKNKHQRAFFPSVWSNELEHEHLSSNFYKCLYRQQHFDQQIQIKIYEFDTILFFRCWKIYCIPLKFPCFYRISRNVCASHSELIFNFINGFLPYALHIIFFKSLFFNTLFILLGFFPKSKHKCKRATLCIFFALKNNDKKHVLTSYRYENGHKWKTNSQQKHFFF